MSTDVLSFEVEGLEASFLPQSEDAARNEFSTEGLSAGFRKAIGFFPTHQKLADKLVFPIRKAWKSGERILDPACGAGDLLISFSQRLEVQSTLSRTLKKWGEVLCGFDNVQHFAKITALRLAAIAQKRGAKNNGINANDIYGFFRHIKVFDFIRQTPANLRMDYLVMNPPFISSIEKGEFGFHGKTNASVIFVEKSWKFLEPKRLRAILPDVLRAGTRYEKWRTNVKNDSTHIKTTLVGKFDHKTDVDVFLLDLTRSKRQKSDVVWSFPMASGMRLGDLFDVSVGPVVPFRLESTGSWMKYLDTSNATPWKKVVKLSKSLRFSGRAERGNFIAIRRTSSPSDKKRLVATWIGSVGRKVAVENHLIIVRAKRGAGVAVEKLFKVIEESEAINAWLNKRLRCRHLTVGAVKEIPLRLGKKK